MIVDVPEDGTSEATNQPPSSESQHHANSNSNNGTVAPSTIQEGGIGLTVTPGPPWPPITLQDVNTHETGRTGAGPSLTLPSPSPSYVSSASSATPSSASAGIAQVPSIASLTSTATPSNAAVAIEGRHTIDSVAATHRRDSDEVSQPVHNFFAQQFSAYDSDASDGSLVFSPASADDRKNIGNATTSSTASTTAASSPAPNSTSNVTSSTYTMSNKKDSIASSFSGGRDRLPSVDSVASNGSIRYVIEPPPPPRSPNNLVDTAAGSNSLSQQQQQQQSASQPVNPLLFPYPDRRKWMEQRQQQEEQQRQHHQTMQYHAAVIQAQQAAHAHMQMQQLAEHQCGSSAPYPSHNVYPIDPNMVAAYYHMYGMPPPPGIVVPPTQQHFPHPSVAGSGNTGYPYPMYPQQQQQQQQQQQGPFFVAMHPVSPSSHHQMMQPVIPLPDNQSPNSFYVMQQQLQQHSNPYQNVPIGSGNNLPASTHDQYHHQKQFSDSLPPSYSFISSSQPTPQPPPRQEQQQQLPPQKKHLQSAGSVQNSKHLKQTPQQQPRSQNQERQRKGGVSMAGSSSTFISQASNNTNITNSTSKNPPRPPSGPSVKPLSRSLAGIDTSDSGVMLPTGRWNGGVGGSHQRDSIGTSGGNPVPPPPPPLYHGHGSTSPQGSLHKRTDSYGSMSSLGSIGTGGFGTGGPIDGHPNSPRMTMEDHEYARNRRAQTRRSLSGDHRAATSPCPAPPSPTGHLADVKKGNDDTEVTVLESPHHAVAHVRKNSFLDMLRMGWSPRSRNSPSSTSRKRPNVDDFHRLNQEFLQRETLAQTFPPQSTAGVSPSTSKQQHRRLGSQDHPPPSRGTHRRLQSISNDEWNEDGAEEANNEGEVRAISNLGANGHTKDRTGYLRHDRERYSSNEETSESGSLIDDEEVEDYSDDNVEEHTSLLPPSGISSNEKEEKDSNYGSFTSRRSQHTWTGVSRIRPQQRSSIEKGSSRRLKASSASDATIPASRSMPSRSRNVDTDASAQTDKWDNRASSMVRKARKKKYRRKSQKSRLSSDSSQVSDDSSDSNIDFRQWTKWTKKRPSNLEKERAKLIEQLKAEARAESEMFAKEEESIQWHRQMWTNIVAEFQKFATLTFRGLTFIEAFIGNLPLTIGAVALSVVSLGVVWFKFAEEYMDTCEPVHFHSSQCTFPEFPGCFYCDTNAKLYKLAIGFHYSCKVISGLLGMLVVAKILLATRVVMDEMSSPTTSSPAGLLCMTAVCVFAGRGLIGQVIVSVASCAHLGLAIWFIYMALAYHIMPEPSWFPNTVGIGLSAVKTWLYYPMPGHLLMAISLSLNFFFFPISLIRVMMNKKISATVAWMQMSAPAISLYALTIMAQPSFEEEHPDVTNFQRVHRMVYLPCMHVMCALSLLGMAASIYSLWVRWPDFRNREFSPAHAAFCFPTLSHANAIQAYRGAVMSFSDVPPRTWRMYALDTYWLVVLSAGTIATVWICGKFLYKLPDWTKPDLSDEEEPPAPYDTLLSQQRMLTAGDHLTQPFVSPAILQANETGALILLRSSRDGTLRYVRTRRIRALGFEPTMNWSEMQEEREVLLEWVGKHPPRRRHRTLSVPGIDFNYGASLSSFGTGNSGTYGSLSPLPQSLRRSLSQGDPSASFV